MFHGQSVMGRKALQPFRRTSGDLWILGSIIRGWFSNMTGPLVISLLKHKATYIDGIGLQLIGRHILLI